MIAWRDSIVVFNVTFGLFILCAQWAVLTFCCGANAIRSAQYSVHLALTLVLTSSRDCSLSPVLQLETS
jgi:hypothetical protein